MLHPMFIKSHGKGIIENVKEDGRVTTLDIGVSKTANVVRPLTRVFLTLGAMEFDVLVLGVCGRFVSMPSIVNASLEANTFAKNWITFVT